MKCSKCSGEMEKIKMAIAQLTGGRYIATGKYCLSCGDIIAKAPPEDRIYMLALPGGTKKPNPALTPDPDLTVEFD